MGSAIVIFVLFVENKSFELNNQLVDNDIQRQGHGSVTDHSQSPAHESGTVCRLRCEP